MNFNIKRIFPLFLLVLIYWQDIQGQGNAPQRIISTIPVRNIAFDKEGDYLSFSMDMLLASMELKSDKALLITPWIVNGPDYIQLQQIGIYGRNRWYQLKREGNGFHGDGREFLIEYKKRPAAINYSQRVPYKNWMNGAQLVIYAEVIGCCNSVKDYSEYIVAEYRNKEFKPSFLYVQKAADVEKTREISGRAYIDFKVNQTGILPDFRNNRIELNKITGTIDSVKNDADITILSLTIKGTASPEGPYENNVRLAKGRTDALKNYVSNLYQFPSGFIKTSYDPVDWDGLREYLETSQLEHRNQILSIINSPAYGPEMKNNKIKANYPYDYRYLLNNVYPALRHSDYKIEYIIREFTTVDEISAVFNAAPQKLSLNEMYNLAQIYEPGTQQFNDIYITAVKLYPFDPIANINAANAAMERGDLNGAEKFLYKSGDSPEAIYAKANFLFLQGNKEEALELYRQVSGEIDQAREAVEALK